MTYILYIVLFIFLFKVASPDSTFTPYWTDQNVVRVLPKLGECYVMYAESEIVPNFACPRPANPKRQTCTELMVETGKTGIKRYCLGLRTVLNERVELLCKHSKEEILSPETPLSKDFETCFNVYSTNNSLERGTPICQEMLHFNNWHVAVGIKTPSVVILFKSNMCPTSTNAYQRQNYSNFRNNFSFDADIRSCYKVYTPDQTISPHTCLNKDIQRSCVDKLAAYEDCFGIVTPNNETVILDCPQDNKMSTLHNCFKIYTSDSAEHVACLNMVEERCVGITTPSNLTVLLECYYCRGTRGPYNTPFVLNYDPEDQRGYRKFVKTYIANEYLGKNFYFDKTEFEVHRLKNQFQQLEIAPCDEWKPTTYAYWLPHTSCYGVTLESNETIILQCESDERQARSGCFELITSEKKHHNVCPKAINERCVGITTPQNFAVVLACYSQMNCSYNNVLFRYINTLAESYKFRPMLNTCYEIYNSSQDVVDGYSCLKKASPEKYSCIDWIPGQRRCLGLKTPTNEIIEFLCDNSVKKMFPNTLPNKTCYNVYNSDKSVAEVCQTQFGKYGMGITTPSNFSILMDSVFCNTSKTTAQIEDYKKFVDNFWFDAEKKACYKVFQPHQEISPYTCVSEEAYDSCISMLEERDCMGITTHNNETIVLSCFNNTEETNESGCFQIYTTDNEVHTACLEKLEESCVGITTPSNLRVLFGCHTCSPDPDDHPVRYEGRYLLRADFERYHQGKHKSFRSFYYAVESERKSYFTKGHYKVHLLPGHNNCRGITMENLETIVLECLDQKPESPGCFDVYSPIYGADGKIIRSKQKVQKACVEIVNRGCLGIPTPNNRTLLLACYKIKEAMISEQFGLTAVPNNKPPLRQ